VPITTEQNDLKEAAMKSIFEVCTPRPEILKGQFKQSDFAARLKDVIDQKADSNQIYLEPSLFFQNTYPTEGLKELAKTVFGRLVGKQNGAPAIRLETSFGGGKTHDLIALYHLAKSGKALSDQVAKILPPDWLPDQPVQIAGIVAGDMDAVNGMIHPDGSQALTLWGEMIYQLQGADGFEAFKDYDQRKVPPSDTKMIEIIGSSPTLIMVDEIAKYIRNLDDKEYVSRIPAFFMSLISVAASLPNVCFVFTLAEGTDAFGAENELIRKELGSVSARECINLTPAKGNEIAQIMAHRLFERIDSSEIENVAQTYHEYYLKERERKVELGQWVDKAKENICATYPFHPELLRVLDKKVGSLDNFQKTRGALMLLSKVVSYLWNHQDQATDTNLIHLHHIPFVSEVLELLTSRLDKPEMKAPVMADIFDLHQNAHAQQLDSINQELGQAPLYLWVATTIFLHSLVKSHNKGASLVEVNYAIANPAIDAGSLLQVIEKLVGVCWHLEPQGEDRFYFQPEPSLNKLIAEEMGKITDTKVLSDLELDVEELYSRGSHFRVFTHTLSPSDIDDAADKPKLVIVPSDEFLANHEGDSPPAAVMNVFQKTGSQDQPRTHKNLMYFVMADRKNFARALGLKREIMALQAIRQSELVFENLTDRQKQNLESRLDIAPLNLRINISNAFCYLAYPKSLQELDFTRLALFESLLPKTSVVTSTEDKQRNRDIDKENRDRQKNFDASDRQNTILKTLEALEKIVTAQSKDIAAKLLKKWVFSTAKKKFSTAELIEFFASEPELPLIIERSKLRQAVLTGIKEGVFHARKGKTTYYKDEPLPLDEFEWGNKLEIALPEVFPPPEDLVKAPEGLHYADISQTGFLLTWEPVEYAESYTVYLNGNAKVSGIQETQYTFSGLQAGMLCEVAVEATGRRNHERSETMSVTTASENAPSGLNYDDISENSAKIKWKPFKGAKSYNIYVNQKCLVQEHNGSSYTLTGLQPSENYEITICANHSGRESEPSVPLKIKTKQGQASHFTLPILAGSPETVFSKLEQTFVKDVSETGGLEEIEFGFESLTDIDLVFGFLQVFNFPGILTYAELAINLEEGDKTSFELTTQCFPLEKLSKLNLKGMLQMLKEMGSPDLELRLHSAFDAPVKFEVLQKIRQALVSKKVSEVRLQAKVKRR